MTYRLLKIGTDLELFLRDSAGNPAPVCGLLGGTKSNPRQVLTDLGDGFAVQEDNVMAEFNIPASNNIENWLQDLSEMEKYLKYYFEGKGRYTIHSDASMRFAPEQLQSEQAKTFGCDPDFDIWALSQNVVSLDNPELETLRTAGGHVHVSFLVDDEPPKPEDVIGVVKLLDIYLGVPSILFDTDSTRRKVYGRAGAFRAKPYGVEYRVLSGKWFTDSASREWVFESVGRAFRELRRPTQEVNELLESEREKILETINESSDKHMDHFFSRYSVYSPKKKRTKSVAASRGLHPPTQPTELAMLAEILNRQQNANTGETQWVRGTEGTPILVDEPTTDPTIAPAAFNHRRF